MDAAFGWLGDLLRWLAHFLPRMRVIPLTERACVFVRGKHARPWGPGWFHWYWPFWTIVEQLTVKRTVLDVPDQTVTTKDGHAVAAGIDVVWEITDIVLAVTECDDVEDMVSWAAKGSLRDFVCSRDFDQVARDRRHGGGRKLETEINNRLQGLGVQVAAANITTFAKTRVMSIIGSETVTPTEENEDE